MCCVSGYNRRATLLKACLTMSQSPLIAELIESFKCLPGVGPKSAARMTYQLLERNREGAQQLAHKLLEAMDSISHCEQCRTFTENKLCQICANSKRNHQQLCIVETPSDVQAIEQTAGYSGIYFVLMGHLSPLDGIGPEDIGLKELAILLEKINPDEIILALSATIEGDATCHYIAQMTNNSQAKITRIAQGVPMGGELEQVDGNTLALSMSSRREY